MFLLETFEQSVLSSQEFDWNFHLEFDRGIISGILF